MLDYIKKQIRAQQAPTISAESNNKLTPDSVPNDVILEYAQLYQELDDLTEKGTDSTRERALGIDIPLEDDIEIENIEFNLKDGRVSDVPADATVTESYKHAKTYDEFYYEAAETISMFARESGESYDARIREVADKAYTEYCTEMTELGMFGFGKINIGDERVPSKVNINFGPYMENGDSDFIGKVNTFFATDKNHNITKKQLDSFNLVKDGAFKNIGKSLKAYMESQYDMPTDESVWEYVTPRNLIVPKGNNNSFCVVLEYYNEMSGKNEYFGWTKPIKDTVRVVQETFDPDLCEKENMKSFANETHYENKDRYLQEAAIESKRERRIRRPLVRFVQEAIDFGGADDSGSDPSPDNSETGNTGDTSSNNDTDINSTDTTMDAGNTSDAGVSDNNSSGNYDDGNKETAAVNDVSAKIAENIANQTQNDNQSTNNDNSGDITFDDDFDNNGSDNTDAGSSIDDQLNDLDNSGSDGFDTDTADDMNDGSDESMDISDDGDVDINNMTIDDLIEQGSEKLKGMTIQQIKNFITSGSPDAVQEAFIITSKNINKEVDVSIRNCLGVLNDNKIDVNKIISRFRIQGHHLNRVLSKAVKMKKIYSDDEIESISSLNTALQNLMLSLKKTKDSGNISKIKRSIASFTAECKTVANIVELKLSNPELKIKGEVKQEGFVQEGLFLSANNAKKRLSSKIPPVYSDLMDIVKTYDQGKLTKGKLMRMYKPKKTEYQQTTGGYHNDNGNGGTIDTTTVNRSYEVNTPQMNNLEALLKVVGKILRKSKTHIAFTSDEMAKIDELGESLDDFIDYLESIVVDSGDSKSIIDQIAKDAKSLINLLSEVHNFCTGLTPTKIRRYDKNDDNQEDEQIDEKSETDDVPDFDDDDITSDGNDSEPTTDETTDEDESSDTDSSDDNNEEEDDE